MSKSIEFSHPSGETASLGFWRTYQQARLAKRRVSDLYLRDPIKDARFNVPVHSVFGFLTSSGQSHLVYFWSDELTSLGWSNSQEEARLDGLLAFGVNLASISEKSPGLATALDFAGLSKLLVSEDREVEYEIFWKTFGELSFCCIAELQKGAEDQVHPPMKVLIEDCLSFHCDYFCGKSPVWSTIPLRFLLDSSKNSSSAAKTFLIEPRLFNPVEKREQSLFSWPWQKSVSDVDQKLCQKGQMTTSLVFDLRKSTLAMEASQDIGLYSPFIERVVETARECVFEYGGYFDKETGDGIVAHFIDFGDAKVFDCIEPQQKRAFDASVVLLRRVAELCEEYQIGLDDWINNLGGAIGLHDGNAVWSIRDRNAQAIGSSVVKAARLCAEAKVLNIFVSNAFFNIVSKQIRPETVAKFERLEYLGKENGDTSQRSGFTVCVRDVYS
jgi:class 3 adenylate cyclase